ncbi:MAG: oligosaccharide repeat unit polymerase [Bacteroidetes bacterium]|nr:oligosaccharide repeat unit polymerase [Bacteroidota bacterium]
MSVLRFPVYRLHLAFVQIAIFIALFITYKLIINPVYEYSGFSADFSAETLVISCVLMSFLLFIGLYIRNEFLYACWQILFLFMFPGTAVFQVYNSVSINPLFAVSLFLFILAFSDVLSFRIKGFSLNINENDRNLYAFLLIVLLMILPFVLYLPYINLKNLFFIDIYKTRLIFREVQSSISGYLYSPLSRVALPALIVISIARKKWLLLVFSAFLLIYLFLCGAQKGVFIGLIAALLFIVGTYKFKPLFFSYLVLGLTVLGIMVFIIGNYLQLDASISNSITGVFIRRVFFVPPMLDAVYYEHFADTYLYYSHSFPMNLFVDYPLEKDLSMYIGQDVLNYIDMRANVGVVTESFVSLGYFGVVIISFIFMIIFSFLKNLNIEPMYFGIIFVYLFQMNSSYFPVLLATHGLLFMVLFFWLFLNNKKSINLE